ncbi:hypothetical protein V6243_03605 [Cobetia marina]|uniref:Alpha/beta hydrolase n=1 Tax=Cobetia marina TaxID=28258 RepID=A0ABU9GBQ3_COBMA
MTNDQLIKLVKQQSRQISQLRSKFFDMQKALIGSSVIHEDSDLYPYEIIDNGSEVTIIAFGGMLTSLGMPRKEFFGSAFNSNNNFIFLKDFWQCWYQKGLLGITNDIDSTVSHIKKILPNTTKKLICIGTSSGGFAAILFAELLKAETSISFSPQTYLDRKTFVRFRSPDSRWDDVESSSYLRLYDFITDDVNHFIHVGEHNHVDMDHALSLSICPTVTIHKHDTDTHNTAAFLKKSGLLKSFINF